MKKKRLVRSPKLENAFLDALAEGANVADAAKAAGVPRRTIYEWRAKGGNFAAEWLEASQIGTDALEAEAQRRAVQGVEKPVFHQGQVVGHVREYSDTLLMFLLKRRDPERFDDRIRAEKWKRDNGVKDDDAISAEALAAVLAGLTAIGDAKASRRSEVEG